MAAGSGIGAGCARVLDVRGYRVVLMSRTEAATVMAHELGGIGFQSSLTSDADLQNLVAVAIGEYHRTHAVINSTGHGSGSTGYSDERLDHSGDSHLLDIADEEWHRNLDLYLLNVIRMARHVTPIIAAAGGGAIGNISALGRC